MQYGTNTLCRFSLRLFVRFKEDIHEQTTMLNFMA